MKSHQLESFDKLLPCLSSQFLRRLLSSLKDHGGEGSRTGDASNATCCGIFDGETSAPWGVQQAVGAALFNDTTSIHHDHLIGVDDCVETMSDSQNCVAGKFRTDRLLHNRVGAREIKAKPGNQYRKDEQKQSDWCSQILVKWRRELNCLLCTIIQPELTNLYTNKVNPTQNQLPQRFGVRFFSLEGNFANNNKQPTLDQHWQLPRRWGWFYFHGGWLGRAKRVAVDRCSDSSLLPKSHHPDLQTLPRSPLSIEPLKSIGSKGLCLHDGVQCWKAIRKIDETKYREVFRI